MIKKKKKLKWKTQTVLNFEVLLLLKMHFHFNASLTAISVAKAIIRKSYKKDQEISMSIADIQTELHNRALAQTIFSIYGIDPKFNENDDRLRLILDFGKIAA